MNRKDFCWQFQFSSTNSINWNDDHFLISIKYNISLKNKINSKVFSQFQLCKCSQVYKRVYLCVLVCVKMGALGVFLSEGVCVCVCVCVCTALYLCVWDHPPLCPPGQGQQQEEEMACHHPDDLLDDLLDDDLLDLVDVLMLFLFLFSLLFVIVIVIVVAVCCSSCSCCCRFLSGSEIIWVFSNKKPKKPKQQKTFLLFF